MQLKQYPSKTFFLQENGTTKGEVRILPPVLTGCPKQVEIRTWNAKGRWRHEQSQVIDMQVIAAILSEGDSEKS